MSISLLSTLMTEAESAVRAPLFCILQAGSMRSFAFSTGRGPARGRSPRARISNLYSSWVQGQR
jgi:hypothetical protein